MIDIRESVECDPKKSSDLDIYSPLYMQSTAVTRFVRSKFLELSSGPFPTCERLQRDSGHQPCNQEDKLLAGAFQRAHGHVRYKGVDQTMFS